MSGAGFVIAIDGPSGAGKSTVARRVADQLGFQYLDSGALYRAVALAALEGGVDLSDSRALNDLLGSLTIRLDRDRVLLNGRDVAGLIRTEQVSQAASKVSSLEAVRHALIDLQRGAAGEPGSVVEGRDMGTVVFPDANLKIFLDADVDERAGRRTRELQGRGHAVRMEDVRSEMLERDLRDRTRAVAPLCAASDALVLDSTRLTIDEVVGAIVAEAHRRGAGN